MKPPIVRSVIAALSIAVIALGIHAVHLRRLLEKERLEVDLDLKTANSVRVASAPSRGDSVPVDHLTQPEPRATDPAFDDVSGALPNRRVQPVLEKPAPEMLQRANVQRRTFLAIDNPDIGEALGLEPEQVNALFDLISQQVLRLDSGTMSRNVGEDPLQVYLRLQQANEAEIAALLGSKYPSWRQYQTEAPIREQMKDLKFVLDAENLPPLNQAAADAMRLELNRAQMQISQQHSTAMATMRQAEFYTTENIQTLSEVASRYLTPEQLSAYKQMLARTAGRERAGLTETAGAE